MSIRLPASAIQTPVDDDNDGSSAASSENNEELEGYSDWVEDEQPCKSLFDGKVLDSANAAVEYDKTNHGFDIHEVSNRLELDFHQRARLINYIRKDNVPASALSGLTGTEAFFSNDEYLKPALEDDPLLQLQSADWSDSEADAPDSTSKSKSKRKSNETDAERIKRLEAELAEARRGVLEYRDLVKKKFEVLEDIAFKDDDESPKRDDDTHYFNSYGYNGEWLPAHAVRFSHTEQLAYQPEIHALMIQDTVRTSTYNRFMLSNPAVFKDAVVMDVGCGTGILSLFAARAGAKKVFAIEASDVAEKAKEIIRDNEYEHVITVIRNKVEDLTSLPDGHEFVDIIISEWMGYCCIYESMLDSVLVARDRFLRKPEHKRDDDDEREGTQGLMAPSQCRMEFGLLEATDAIRERIKFWDDVYGFKMSAMAGEVYDEAIVDVFSGDALLGNCTTIKDIPIQHISIKSLDFVSPFKLTTTRSGELSAFVCYFDTFFTPDGKDLDPTVQVEIYGGEFGPGDVLRIGERRNSGGTDSGSRRQGSEGGTPRKKALGLEEGPVESLTGEPLTSAPTSFPPPPPPPPAPPAPQATLNVTPSQPSMKPPGSPMKRPSLRSASTTRRESTSSLPRMVSFSTGPRSMPTHWKQTAFLLRNPVKVRKGTTVSGNFYCKKSEDNSRELDVEIHYLVEDPYSSIQGTPKAPVQKETIVQMYKIR
ncbi:hypothetical protein FRC03_005061 [Tulasnella sp. 419]|nr:hypothetical protein FRC03_005061 [Tulasnella sp. 419]